MYCTGGCEQKNARDVWRPTRLKGHPGWIVRARSHLRVSFADNPAGMFFQLNEEKMPSKCATRRHFRLISAYAETASPPGGISISYETLIKQALPPIPCIFLQFTFTNSLMHPDKLL